MLKEFDVTDIEKKARTTRGVQDDTDSEMEMEPMLTEDDGKRQTMFANVGTLSAGSHTVRISEIFSKGRGSRFVT